MRVKLSKNLFLNKFNISESKLDQLNIDWEDLMDIYTDFLDRRPSLIKIANFIAESLRDHSKVHTVRSRVKDPEHLIEKLIRKTEERREKHGNDFNFSKDNYLDEKVGITDIVGIRAIHIFKEDHRFIDSMINNTWEVAERTANIREGDQKATYEELGLKITSRQSGYRSVHYLVKTQPTTESVIVEIQVRTIFEEAYGEIDHLLSYPKSDVPYEIASNLLVLNRLAGSADEMGSMINQLSKTWNEKDKLIESQKNKIDELKEQINKSQIPKDEKDSITVSLDNNFADLKNSLNQRTLFTYDEETGKWINML